MSDSHLKLVRIEGEHPSVDDRKLIDELGGSRSRRMQRGLPILRVPEDDLNSGPACPSKRW